MIDNGLDDVPRNIDPTCTSPGSPDAIGYAGNAARHICKLHERLVVTTQIKLHVTPMTLKVSDETRCFLYVRHAVLQTGCYLERRFIGAHMDIQAARPGLIASDTTGICQFRNSCARPAQLA